ncbi:hypothetical protein [Phycicoccus sonneratiae]|uniref:Uncharacterized protein n=1 Tax=Phycicoccus sonneratiae TaxID=2807628 RepID=A0ABS2CQQ8_9MICO|nr:hypothetical protein [Phycicoccus sonneraticus]MBM6402158.1 hypothetical protein [Phycicoccus sonneraticus]
MNESTDSQRPAADTGAAATTTRDAALEHLAITLALLGDAASRATHTSHDVRLHIVACQAEHLAGEVRTHTEPATPQQPWPVDAGYATTTAAARRALDVPEVRHLPVPLRASLQWLLLLAEAAQT